MSTAECGGAHGGGGEGSYTDRFGRMQKVQGPDNVRLRLHNIINKGLQCNRPQLAYCKSHWHEYMAVSTRALGQRD